MTEKLKRIKKAADMFNKCYNCAQATAIPFHDIVGVEEDTLIKASCAFGGGVARMRNVCGVVSGMALVFGLSRPCLDVTDPDAKADMYEKAQELINKFSAKNESVICSELLDDFEKNPIMEEPYSEKPCLKLVEDGAAILCDYLEIE